MAGPFDRFLASQGFVVLDGGLATALEDDGHVLDSDLWSASLLIDDPEAIRAAHTRYLEAGADCVSTASYQATLGGFARLGLDGGEGAELLRRSVALAVEARDDFWSDAKARPGRRRPLVAASIGPYGAYLADGSEYDGRYATAAAPDRDMPGATALGARELANFHRPTLEILADAGADLLALETIPSVVEAQALAGLLGEVRHPGAWISFSCRDGERLWDGTPVEQAASVCGAEAGLIAIGVNCTAPRHVASLVRRMRAASDLPILAYPNSGETYDAGTGRWSGQPAGEDWLDQVPQWVRAGARAVGGCCRVGPDLIRGVRRHMEETRW